MAFKASRAKSGLFEIHGLEAFIEKKVAELRAALGLSPKNKSAVVAPVPSAPKPAAVPAPKKAAPAPAAAPKKKKASAAKAKPAAATAADPLSPLLAALDAHPKKAALIKAGKQKDQLLRSLIPLYLAKGNLEVSSGTTSRFWAKHGVRYAAPNAAKAIREHVGYAKRTKTGPQITPNGIKYVEGALKA